PILEKHIKITPTIVTHEESKKISIQRQAVFAQNKLPLENKIVYPITAVVNKLLNLQDRIDEIRKEIHKEFLAHPIKISGVESTINIINTIMIIALLNLHFASHSKNRRVILQMVNSIAHQHLGAKMLSSVTSESQLL